MNNDYGVLRKMKTHPQSPVRYEMPLGERRISMNELLGRKLHLRFSGNIYCIDCGRKTSKSFNQGYCYPCFRDLAECDHCIVKPELCHFHKGTCRQPQWGEQHCMQPHIVYLANSSGLKVGITRAVHVPTRWMDQGAVRARPLMAVGSRYQSGLVEVAVGKHISDRTNWRKMLQGDPEPLDLEAEAQKLMTLCRDDIGQLADQFGAHNIAPAPSPVTSEFRYPVEQYPEKIKSHNPEKTPLVEGVLRGIKGQYLIFDNGVINIRKYGGYEVALDAVD